MLRKLISLVLLALVAWTCTPRKPEAEQIRLSDDGETPEGEILEEANPADTLNSIRGSKELNQIPNTIHEVVLTGIPPHRLVPIYKVKRPGVEVNRRSEGTRSAYDSYGYEYTTRAWDYEEHYMPGIDVRFGYNLINIAHYDLTSEKLNFLFEHPVLVKSLYYPSFVQDSINKKPINRDYFLVSVYNSDTNGDTIINKHDLRRFFHFNASCDVATQLIPSDYSVVRSQYDAGNDVMYVYGRHDVNKDGKSSKEEPLHIFWISLKNPGVAKRLY